MPEESHVPVEEDVDELVSFSRHASSSNRFIKAGFHIMANKACFAYDYGVLQSIVGMKNVALFPY